MRRTARGATSILLSVLLISADVAVAAQKNDEPAPAPAGAQRSTVRRPSNALCTGIGLVVGLIAGALLGNRRRGDGFNETGALIGGVGATLICRAVRWRSVDDRDQQNVNQEVATMTADPNATSRTYRSPTTGITYTITAGETSYRNVNTEITTLTTVDAPQRGYKVTSYAYRVNAMVLNLRGTPGSETSDRITGAFYQNDLIEGLSETPDGQWVLVGYDNVGYGWVSRRYLLPVPMTDQIVFDRPGPPQTQVAVAAPPPPPPPPPAARSRRRGRAATPARPPAGPVLVRARMTTVPATQTQRVRGAQMACHSYTVRNGGQSDTNRGCRGAGGAVGIERT